MLHRLQAPTDEPSLRATTLEPRPVGRRLEHPRPLHVLLSLPILDFLGPRHGGNEGAQRCGLTEGALPVVERVGIRRGILAEIGHQVWPIEGDEPGPRVDGQIEDGHVGVADEDFGMATDKVPIQERQQLAGMVAPDGRDDNPHTRIGDEAVDVRDPLLRGTGHIAATPVSMRRDHDAIADRLEVGHPLRDAMREGGGAAPRRSDDPDGITGAKGGGFHGRWLACLVTSSLPLPYKAVPMIVKPQDNQDVVPLRRSHSTA